MSNSALTHGFACGLPFRRVSTRKSATKNFRRVLPRNPLKNLNSRERIQGNPRKSNPHNRGFRSETVRGQENPNEPTGLTLRSPLPRGEFMEKTRRSDRRPFGRPTAAALKAHTFELDELETERVVSSGATRDGRISIRPGRSKRSQREHRRWLGGTGRASPNSSPSFSTRSTTGPRRTVRDRRRQSLGSGCSSVKPRSR
jgi:hypothetical protein